MSVAGDEQLALPTALARWARLRPDDVAFTFVDFEYDLAGTSETLTWRQLHNRVRNVAAELSVIGFPKDRVVITAPQNLDYIVAFLGALEAGLVAVPLLPPQLGAHDGRFASVLADASPAAVMTTSAVAGALAPYARRGPALIEIDALDLDGPADFACQNPQPGTAYLQYTSGSTREPAGVQISHRNLAVNFEQTMQCYFPNTGNTAPPDTTMVSWLPFYHDMGLFIGVCSPILAGLHSVVFNPLSFLMRPSRWIRQIATHSKVFTPAPNFALELAVRRTSDADMNGLDLGDVTHVVSGAERVHAATLKRFTDRFVPFGLRPEALRPSYGLAEGTVYVAARIGSAPPDVVHFDSEKLSAGIAERTTDSEGLGLVSYGVPRNPSVRVVDPGTGVENPVGVVGEIWVHGENVSVGYWRKPEQTNSTFGGRIGHPAVGTPGGRWLRTGDLGVLSEDELFIVGRIKDLVIVDGRNHYPDDIEATVRELIDGRAAAISVTSEEREKLVVIAEFVPTALAPDDMAREARKVRTNVTAAISAAHNIRLADLVLVAPASLPVTTSGKVKRSACAQLYRRGELTMADD